MPKKAHILMLNDAEWVELMLALSERKNALENRMALAQRNKQSWIDKMTGKRLAAIKTLHTKLGL